ncbi:MAG: LysR family transcriptional regulator [Candidatus Nanopelagicales bacterium]|jgi:DNA-binding transcriptional LysR family regulator|nr:LysR family transcriptional regulator [Candidatus Nanopelagicales bacterium]
MLSTNLLEVHRTVVQVGSLTAAAHELGYTVSAVSQQLERLEQQAGMALFEKAGRGVRPTEAGLLLAQHAERILHEVHEAQDALAALREGRAGRLRVVTFFSAGETLIPQAIAAMRTELPGLHVRPTVDEEAGALRRLRAGEVELVVVVEPFGRGQEPEDDLHRWHLLDDEYRILLPHDHVLARRRTVRIEDLVDQDWVVTSGPIDYVRSTTMAICRRAGYTPRFVAETDEFPATLGYVAAGIGVSLVPVLALGAVRRGVVARRLAPPPEPRHIWAATRAPLRHHPPVVRMAAALRAAARGIR